jgi:hypothetical protein
VGLHVVGVRHHSPACARVVAHTIREVRPKIVLVEGPSDMNGRTDELLLGHAPPVAIYAFAAAENGPRRGSFWPMAAYSPEWVALHVAREVGAEARFIDLPSYDRVFASIENHYADRHLRASARIGELAARLGFDDTDSLWDHLFEQPAEEAELLARLRAYFEALRADEAADPGDRAREAWMARFVAWAVRAHEDVVVVCGGYHAPELERAWTSADAAEPSNPPPPEGTRTGAYLVPFSFRRLDAFAGYAAGQPSPAFYQEVWEHGPAAGAERMARAAIQELRKRQQRVSPADAIAASAMAEGLRRLRGHACLLRRDVLDGLAAALLKEATDAPLPWTRRGVILPRTHPLLVALVDAFSGARIGKLAPGTPRPPLVTSALAELEACDVALSRTPKAVEAEAGSAKSCTLHRFRILGAPGIERTRAPDYRRGQTRLSESWNVVLTVELEPSLIEAAAYGATLEDAACAVLEERAAQAKGSGERAEIVLEAAAAGLGSVAAKVFEALREGILREPDLGELGRALAIIHGVLARDAAGFDRKELGALVESAYDRATWLFEGITGEGAPAEESHVGAVVAMRDVVRQPCDVVRVDPAVAGELAARRAADAEAPAYVRGAALGFGLAIGHEVTSAGGTPIARAEAARAVRAAARPERLGDFLLGLFAVAREEVRGDVEVVGAVDLALEGMSKHAFAVALPSLRRAFTYFPPRERLSIAEHVMRLHGGADADPTQLVAPLEADASRGLALDVEVTDVARRFGLEEGDAP